MPRIKADDVTNKWKELKGARSEWHTRSAPGQDYFNGYDNIRWNTTPPDVDRNLAVKEAVQ